MALVVLVSLLLTLNIFHTCSIVSVVNLVQVNAGWAGYVGVIFQGFFQKYFILHFSAKIRLHKSKHLVYLEKGLKHLPESYEVHIE